jgi:hypothetical protein
MAISKQKQTRLVKYHKLREQITGMESGNFEILIKARVYLKEIS